MEFYNKTFTNQFSYTSNMYVASLLAVDTVNINYCSNSNSLTLTAADGYTNYVWRDKSNSILSTNRSLVVSNPPDQESYSLSMSSTTEFKNLIYKILRYDISPDFTFSGNCESKIVTFANQSTTNKGTLNYTWDFGDGTNSAERNPVHTFTDYGIHKVKLTVKNIESGCELSITKDVETPAPIKIDGNLIICQGESTTLTATADAGYQFKWNTGEITKSIAVNKSDRYWVVSTSISGCLIDTVFADVYIPELKADYTFTNNCESNTVYFTNKSSTNVGALSYRWDFGEGNFSTDKNPIYTFSSFGVHTVKLIIRSIESGCESSVTYNVETPARVKVDGQLAFCFGESTSLTASGVPNFKWSTGETIKSITVTKHGKYWVIGTSITGCVLDTFFINVTQYPEINLNITGEPVICKGNETTLTASGAAKYEWNTGDKTASIKIDKAGNYKVTATSTNGCLKSKSFEVAVLELPNVEFILSPSVLEHDKRTIIASLPPQPNVTFIWNMGDGTTKIGNFVEHTYNISETTKGFQITLSGKNKYGCEQSSKQIISVAPFIPNVFTPNGDGINDIFAPDYDLKIYDRHGLLLYSGTNGWNGTYKEKPIEGDTYFYYVTYKDAVSKIHTKKGSITLIR